ncbi:helix-turn-helix transcriptional regulator [Cereibacter sphaeroides]|uniref:helix-turn-helix domain-containing protein n=1 Tax=Cereibacter sphaeroides TaxID=1063 RepID=UPI00313B4B1C
MDGQHPFCRRKRQASSGGSLYDCSLPVSRNTSCPRPLVDCLQIRADFSSEGPARRPASDQLFDQVLGLHAGYSGQNIQKYKMEETSMGKLSICRQNVPMKSVPSRLPKIDQAGVARRLEALRDALGLDKGEFAQSFGLDPSSYSKVLQGKKPLKSEYGHAIAEGWGVSMDFIYRGDMSRIDDTLRAKVMQNLTAPMR